MVPRPHTKGGASDVAVCSSASQAGRATSRPAHWATLWMLLLLGALTALGGIGLLDPPASLATPGIVTVGATAESASFTVQAKTQRIADDTLAKAEVAWKHLAPHFTRGPAEPIEIVVVEDSGEYERIQPAPMTRGFATFGGHHIYILGDQLDQEVVTHELVHILLGYNVRPGLWLPDWFNEGLAQWASDSPPRSLELMYTASSGRLLSLTDLDRIDALTGPDRQMATIQGVAVVRFLADVYGEDSVWALVRNLSTAESFNDALLDTFGYTDLQLSNQWMAYAEDTYDLLSPAGFRVFASLAFAALIVVAVITWFLRRVARSTAMALEPALTLEEIAAARRAESTLLPPPREGPESLHDPPPPS